LLPKSQAVLVSVGVAVVLLGVWASARWWPGGAGDLAGVASLIAVLRATVTQLDGTARATILLGEASLLVLVALWALNTVALLGALGFSMFGEVFRAGVSRRQAQPVRSPH
jgi:hypothetical protein